jgi:putative tributyrin esterase
VQSKDSIIRTNDDEKIILKTKSVLFQYDTFTTYINNKNYDDQLKIIYNNYFAKLLLWYGSTLKNKYAGEYSKELKKNTQVNVLLPDAPGKPFKTLWLLHGLSDDHSAWMRKTAIERYARDHGLAVVMPNADRSWYTNTAYGINYFNFVAKELPALCRSTFGGMSEQREDNIVAGLSMGGYGALKLALTYPAQYAACISLSGSLDVTRKGRKYDPAEWKSIFGKDAPALAGSEHDLFALAKAKGAHPLPAIYLWCGTQDSLIDINRAFDAHLTGCDIPHEFHFSEGDHSWKWWDLHIQNALKWALER